MRERGALRVAYGYASLDLDTLALTARSGDAAARNVLIRRIQPDVMRRCRKRLPCLSDAEEACNDVLFQVARHLPSFEGRSRFTTWLYSIVGRCIYQTYRSLKRRSMENADVGLLEDQPAPPNARVSVLAGARIELLDAVDEVRHRNPTLVEPFLLRDLADLGYDEVAGLLGLPVSTVKSRVHTARQIVQSYLRRTRSDG